MAASNPDVKNRITILNFDERVARGPLRVEVSVGMHIFYKMIVDKLDLEASEGTARFIEAIKLYVFLGGLFEAWANEFLRQYLVAHQNVPQELFEAIERKQLQEKLSVIGRGLEAPWWGEGVRFIRGVSEMRNRLMHFKDAPTVAHPDPTSTIPSGPDPTLKGVWQGIQRAAPNPRIYDELVDQDLVAVRRTASELYDRLLSLPAISSEEMA